MAKSFRLDCGVIRLIVTAGAMIEAVLSQINGLSGEFFSTQARCRFCLRLRAKKFSFKQDIHSVNAFCGKPVDWVSNRPERPLPIVARPICKKHHAHQY
jgi:hypothetical protein